VGVKVKLCGQSRVLVVATYLNILYLISEYRIPVPTELKEDSQTPSAAEAIKHTARQIQNEVNSLRLKDYI